MTFEITVDLQTMCKLICYFESWRKRNIVESETSRKLTFLQKVSVEQIDDNGAFGENTASDLRSSFRIARSYATTTSLSVDHLLPKQVLVICLKKENTSYRTNINKTTRMLVPVVSVRCTLD